MTQQSNMNLQRFLQETIAENLIPIFGHSGSLQFRDGWQNNVSEPPTLERCALTNLHAIYTIYTEYMYLDEIIGLFRVIFKVEGYHTLVGVANTADKISEVFYWKLKISWKKF